MKDALISIPLLALGLAGLALAQAPGLSPEKARLAEAIKPSEGELRWQQIPWETDLGQGLRLAQAEKRPIFLWVTGDDPLERC